MKILKRILVIIMILSIVGGYGVVIPGEVYAATKKKTKAVSAKQEAENKAKKEKKAEEIKKLIEKAKNEHPTLKAGSGMIALNTSPNISFEKGENGKVNVKVTDNTGIAKITKENTKTKNKQEIVANKQKEQTFRFDDPSKGKKKEMEFIIGDATGLTSKVLCKTVNRGSYDDFNVSMRTTFSYSNYNLNIILRDNAGINADNVSIEVIDKNANNKSLGKVKGKKIKIKNAVKYGEKTIYGRYQIDINKLTRDKDKNYFIQVKTLDNSGEKGYKMAKFTLTDEEIAKLDARKEEQKQKEKEEKEKKKKEKKQTKKETKKETKKQTKKETKKETKKQTKKETKKETKKQTKKETKKETKKQTKKVAQIGNKKYEKLATAIKAVKKDKKKVTIKLLTDIKMSETNSGFQINKKQNIVINLNGHSIKAHNKKGKNVFINNGTLVIKGKGTLEGRGVMYSAIENNIGATMKIEGGTINRIKNKGTMTISGGTINLIHNSEKMTISGGTINAVYNDGDGNKRTMTISGGKIFNIDNNSGATMMIEGGTIGRKGNDYAIHNAGKMTIEEKNNKKVKISISSGKKAAICNFYAKATLTIKSGDITSTSTQAQAIENDGGRLNLQGGTIKGKCSAIKNVSGGDLYMTKGVIISQTRRAIYNEGGKVLISGYTGATLSTQSKDYAAIRCEKGSKLKLIKVKMHATSKKFVSLPEKTITGKKPDINNYSYEYNY